MSSCVVLYCNLTRQFVNILTMKMVNSLSSIWNLLQLHNTYSCLHYSKSFTTTHSFLEAPMIKTHGNASCGLKKWGHMHANRVSILTGTTKLQFSQIHNSVMSDCYFPACCQLKTRACFTLVTNMILPGKRFTIKDSNEWCRGGI